MSDKIRKIGLSMKEQIINEATKEVNEEQFKQFKMQYKAKLQEVAKMKKMLSNAERELVDLELKIDMETL